MKSKVVSFPSEYELRSQGYHFIAGVDEAGRGPLAGPVVAAACMMPQGRWADGIRDSKQLSSEQRKKLFWQIISHALVGVAIVDHEQIDQINILRASLLAMKLAVSSLTVTPEIVLIDGPFGFELPIHQIPIIDGDEKVISIGAASIVAKVTRDEIMERYDLQYPAYGFKLHKGYATERHIAALKQHGPCPIHRKTFRRVLHVNELSESFELGNDLGVTHVEAV